MNPSKTETITLGQCKHLRNEAMATGTRKTEEVAQEGVTVVTIGVILRTVGGVEAAAAVVPVLVAASIATPLEAAEAAAAVVGIAVGEVATGVEVAGVTSRWTTLVGPLAAAMEVDRAAADISTRITTTALPTVGTRTIRSFQLCEVEQGISAAEQVKMEVYHMENSEFSPPYMTTLLSSSFPSIGIKYQKNFCAKF